jgi:hypothetical protein
MIARTRENKWQLPHEFPNQERGMDRLAGKA